MCVCRYIDIYRYIYIYIYILQLFYCIKNVTGQTAFKSALFWAKWLTNTENENSSPMKIYIGHLIWCFSKPNSEATWLLQEAVKVLTLIQRHIQYKFLHSVRIWHFQSSLLQLNTLILAILALSRNIRRTSFRMAVSSVILF
jgi:hypothetical protein